MDVQQRAHRLDDDDDEVSSFYSDIHKNFPFNIRMTFKRPIPVFFSFVSFIFLQIFN